MIIGAQKSGTSSLYHYLAQHPQLVPSYVKEVHFFDGCFDRARRGFGKEELWYRAHFPFAGTVSGRQKTFEATPLYFFHPLVPERIFRLLPGIRLLVVMRDPVERALSHYFHERRKERERLPVLEAMLAEEDRLASLIERKDFSNEAFIRYSYKMRGRYYEQLRRYLDYFSMENILLIGSEDFFSDPSPTLRRIFRFVGVDEEVVIPDIEPRNVASNRTEVGDEVYDYLRRYFMPHNRRLYEFCGVNYGW